ncbi:hypothetical protein B7495_17535 [Cryobacterium sp. LW097]|uniref:hypothetical protein n=1 Tax=unclassified Cryobacterium TaxID=2649013 RepID=UPI000B4CA527|nr:MULTISPECIES: hypothetical protein [unclassified Cryobacterium]ASD23706.1 hypothetical protein B7495_17535 [Cryobacterium sp. LW097]TFC58166.1 hypothetical protein E3O60_12160 [Cryobacterium sp. TMB1-7]TFC59660.1 hypothetical protein E3O68_00115 [Cryobacterium sp. TMB3-1-2]TFC68142.1 hypothetical protein E3T21_15320 [Cryobacterium sp. TMB3-15]TFC79246.1 hypothetical protein E3T22_01725 [Cryobacterium sp. TMB3-10]
MSGSSVTVTPHGANRITARAMTRLVSAVAADALAVQPSQVKVDVADAAGRLDLTVRTPLRLLPLDRGETDTSVDDALDRTERAQHDIRGTVATLTGADIAGVTVRLTGAGSRPPTPVD